MTLTEAEVRAVFKNLESGNGDAFFEHVAENVDWTVEGTHPVAGRFRSKSDLRANAFDKVSGVMQDGLQLKTTNIIVGGDWAVVELRSLATARNGLRFDNRYCCVCRFADGKIAEVRAYLDSALEVRLFEENPV
jgi:ketosteroid isomerase-like protein